MRNLRWILCTAWTLPWTLPGLLLALLALPGGGRLDLRRLDGTGALCASGGWIGRLLDGNPWLRIMAITLGQVVLARDAGAMEATLAHELAHVRQFQRWGLLFPFLYLWESWRVWRAGGRAYFDNRYEIEARRAEQD